MTEGDHLLFTVFLLCPFIGIPSLPMGHADTAASIFSQGFAWTQTARQGRKRRIDSSGGERLGAMAGVLFSCLACCGGVFAGTDAPAPPPGASVYIVGPGETLESVAVLWGLNGLQSDSPKPGMRLLVPIEDVEGLLKDDSPHGTWEITDAGRARLLEGKQA